MSRSTRVFLICVGTTFAVWTFWCALMTVFGEPFTSPYLRAFVRISVVLLPAIAYARFGVERRDDFFEFRRNWKVGLLVGAVLAGLFGLLIMAQHSGRSLVIPASLSVWINFIVLSPLAEEMMFRRVVLEHLKSLTTTPLAILLGSILFASFHLPWWLMSGEPAGLALASSWFTLFLYGVGFSIAVQTTKSIWSALLPHWANNLILLSLNP